MPDPTRIYLQPECCADPDTGRMWATKPDHECEHGVAWTEYVLAGEPSPRPAPEYFEDLYRHARSSATCPTCGRFRTRGRATVRGRVCTYRCTEGHSWNVEIPDVSKEPTP